MIVDLASSAQLASRKTHVSGSWRALRNNMQQLSGPLASFLLNNRQGMTLVKSDSLVQKIEGNRRRFESIDLEK